MDTSYYILFKCMDTHYCICYIICMETPGLSTAHHDTHPCLFCMDTHHLYTICMDKPFPLCIDTSYSTSLHTPLSILYGHPPPLHYLYGQTLPPLYRHVIQYIITHTPVYSVWTPTTSTLFVWTNPSPFV